MRSSHTRCSRGTALSCCVKSNDNSQNQRLHPATDKAALIKVC